jgi:hypothetical protein
MMLGKEATLPATAGSAYVAALAAESAGGSATRARPDLRSDAPLAGSLLDGINFHQ